MSQIPVRQLVDPSSEELDKAAETLAAAFENDVFTFCCIGGDKSQNLLFQRATLAAAAVAGQIWVASHGNNDFAAVAAWYGPGRGLLDSPDQGEAGFNAMFAAFPTELTRWWTEYFLSKYGAMCVTALGEGTKVNGWHLQLLGTHPKHQNQGLAKAVTAPILEKAKVDNKVLCLETATEINVSIYKKMGWQVRHGPEQYESAVGGFSMWVLSANDQ